MGKEGRRRIIFATSHILANLGRTWTLVICSTLWCSTWRGCRLSGCLAAWLAAWLPGCLAGWLLAGCWLAGWLHGCLATWLVGSLAGWLAGWLALGIVNISLVFLAYLNMCTQNYCKTIGFY